MRAKWAAVLVFLMSLAGPSPALAQERSFKEWVVSVKDMKKPFAATVNESGAVFGQYCYPESGSCLYIVATASKCEKDANYPVLLNSEAGSAYVELLCGGSSDGQRFEYYFKNFDTINKIALQDGVLGIAFPLDGGQFRVVRFKLDGAKEAMPVLRDAAVKIKGNAPRRNGTRDQTL